MESELWLVTLPCPVGADGNSFMQKLQDTMRNNKLGEFLPFEMPVLSVGTLDILMGLSDDLVKIVGQVESTLKKVERQYYDIAGQTSEKLKVDDVPVPVFYKNFQWDLARYRYGSVPLADIVGNITSMVGGVDMELKRLNTSLSEKIQALTALQRKKVINLNTSDFEDFLSDDDMNKAEVVNSDFLLTVGLIVSAANEKEFLETYDRLGEDIACFGGPEWAHNKKGVGLNDGNYGPASGRGTVRGSPVIPQSAKLVKTHGEHKLYAVTILKGHYEAGVFVDGAFTDGKFVDYLPRLKEAMRSKRITLRELNFDPNTRGAGADVLIEDADKQLHAVKSRAMHWCRSHFGELYSGWLHLKVVRAFVESVLRYGLSSRGDPAKYLSFFFSPNTKKIHEAQRQLTKAVVTLRPEMSSLADFDGPEPEDDNDEDSLPYFCDKFAAVGL